MALAEGDKEKQIEYMLSACEDNLERLSEWERNFVESIRDQFDRLGRLSERQVEILERAYQKVP